MRNRIAVSKAEAVAAKHGRNPFAIARKLGYRLHYADLPPRVQEMIVPETRLLFLNREVEGDPHAARLLVAHALGHAYLHEGNQVCDPDLPRDFFVRHERQAEAFAHALIYGARAGEAV